MEENQNTKGKTESYELSGFSNVVQFLAAEDKNRPLENISKRNFISTRTHVIFSIYRLSP